MEYVDIDITDIAHGGVCVGRDSEGCVVFARFALPGERVRVAVRSRNSQYCKGDVVEVLSSPSQYRVEHSWVEAGPLGVGGADLGHVDFSYQSEWKSHVLRGAIVRVGGALLAEHMREQGIEPRVRSFDSDTVTGGWHTRTRIDLVAGENGVFGMYREGSRDFMPLTSMPLAVCELDELELFSGAWGYCIAPGQRVKAVAASGSEPCLVTNGRTYSAPGIVTDSFVREDVVVDGSLYSYRLHSDGFWQVHREGGAELIRLVMGAAQVCVGDSVLELFSGAGLLTQPVALAVGQRGRVDTFEGARLAVEDARANVRDMPWVSARTAMLDSRRIAKVCNKKYDVIIADPPRSGLGIESARVLANSSARTIVLISCDPASMARDVAAMVECGRRVVKLESIDMFPNTHHFETVTVLQ